MCKDLLRVIGHFGIYLEFEIFMKLRDFES